MICERADTERADVLMRFGAATDRFYRNLSDGISRSRSIFRRIIAEHALLSDLAPIENDPPN